MRRALVLVPLLAACSGDWFAADDFTYSDENWTLETHTSDPVMRLAEDSTYDGPALCGHDNGHSTAESWRFNAPKKYLGNASRVYGARLTWDSQTDGNGRQFIGNDVFLNGRGVWVVARIPNPPSRPTTWASFTVWLDVDKTEWRLGDTGAIADKADLEGVLAGLTSLRIPGEWVDGAETTCIDNVYFGIP